MRRIFKLLTLIAVVFILISIPSPCRFTASENGEHSGYLFRVESQMMKDKLSADAPANGIRRINGSDCLFTAESLDYIRQFTKGMTITHLEPNYYVELLELPDDPEYFQQETYMSLIGYPEVWNEGQDGSGITVAVIDSGLVNGHEDLNYTNILPGVNFTDTGTADDVTDIYGHGSFVSGIMSAVTDNATGIAGLTPQINLLPLKTFNSTTGMLSDIIEAINTAVLLDADVINMSFGLTEHSPELESALEKASEAGILLVAAVGNDYGTAYYYPAAYSFVTGVGAIDSDGIRAGFSQRNDSVHVTAPGVDIFSISHTDTVGYRSSPGTSYSVPFVSSMAAMAKQYDIDIYPASFLNLLSLSATDAGSTGYDEEYGWGIISLSDFQTALEDIYSINYNLNGGNFKTGATVPDLFTVSSSLILHPVPEKNSYWFAGWFDNASYEGDAVTEIIPGSSGNMTLYAKWVDNSYNKVSGYIRLEGKESGNYGGTSLNLSKGETSHSTFSETDGYFIFNNIESGVYTLSISYDSYLTSYKANIILTKYDIILSEVGNPIELLAGDFDGVTGVDTGDLAFILSKLGLVSGVEGYDFRVDFDSATGIDTGDLALVIKNLGLVSEDYPE